MPIATPSLNRRALLTGALAAGGAVALGAGVTAQPALAPFADRIGLELFTVRDLLARDFAGTLAKVAALGYREVEPFGGYNGLSPKAYRALLDSHKLSAPTTHSGPMLGSDLEKQFADFQIMGIRYSSEPETPRPPRTGPPGGADMGAETPGGRTQPPETLDAVKRKAAQLNAWGRTGAKFGVKMLIHNHTIEYAKLADSPKTAYDIYLEETDPALVAMQLDIGWAIISGKDPLAMFAKNPGRYELWHVKDVVGVRGIDPSLPPGERAANTVFTPVGGGQGDYRPIFAQAKLAGLKHFCVEQDNAASFGDSLAAAGVSYRKLRQMLTA